MNAKYTFWRDPSDNKWIGAWDSYQEYQVKSDSLEGLKQKLVLVRAAIYNLDKDTISRLSDGPQRHPILYYNEQLRVGFGYADAKMIREFDKAIVQASRERSEESITNEEPDSDSLNEYQRFKSYFWAGAASIAAAVIFCPIRAAFCDYDCPEPLKILFFPALVFYVFCFIQSTKDKKQRTAEDVGLFLITSIIGMAFAPLFVIASPYFIWKYLKNHPDPS